MKKIIFTIMFFVVYLIYGSVTYGANYRYGTPTKPYASTIKSRDLYGRIIPVKYNMTVVRRKVTACLSRRATHANTPLGAEVAIDTCISQVLDGR